ncbi:MAG: RAD55 family ATPase [Candidatus Hodarchaeota archaeon]
MPLNKIEIVHTGIEGLDAILGGGFPLGWVIVVAGGPGSGKTTLATQFVVQGCLKGEPGILVTMNEPRHHVLTTMGVFGWDLEFLEREELLTILDYSATNVLYSIHKQGMKDGGPSLNFMIDQLKDTIDNTGAIRLMIDPLNAFSFLFHDKFTMRRELHKLFGMLAGRKTVSLTTLELGSSEVHFTVEEFLAYGVIRLYNKKIGRDRERSIEVVKMRGLNQNRSTYPFEISSTGCRVFESTETFDF